MYKTSIRGKFAFACSIDIRCGGNQRNMNDLSDFRLNAVFFSSFVFDLKFIWIDTPAASVFFVSLAIRKRCCKRDIKW